MANPTTESMMYQTMFRQPADVADLLTRGAGPAKDAAGLLAGKQRVVLTGIGSSYHAALVGGWLLRAAGIDARSVSSYDLAAYPESYPLTANDAVIVLAH